MIKNSLIAVALLTVVACGERDTILSGTREDVSVDATAIANVSKPANLPKSQAISSWTHRNGNAAHAGKIGNLNSDLTLAFSAPIGKGNSLRARITADPVVAGGIVYTLDARSQVTATAVNGATVWTADVAPRTADANEASGGGLSFANGRVFVSSGFGVLTALNAATGATIWVQDLDAPGTSAPTVVDGLVYAVARDSSATALDVETGRIEWRIEGTPSVGSFGGGAGAAVTNDIAVFPFQSGEVFGVFPKVGMRRWTTVVSGEELGRAAGIIDDISSDPVIVGNRVYVGNLGGQVAALSTSDGDRIWTANDGAIGPVWPAGNALYLVNNANQLVRLDADTGNAVWRIQLPQTVEGSFGRKPSQVGHFGPVIAGGRIIVASSDGALRQFNPANGALVASVELPGGAASAPAIVGGALYVVSKDGQLLAYR